ncbi:ABC transporter permease [Corynebacterium variabile]|uniref:Taurine ABC transporter permease n=1 Tax=Corynebacterium variabile TaxID=1727 RepID=A0A4Y4C5C7_9CORY|nr:ABC transporter permease subunit [Corynebacterium variabile]GEC86584.1 taurine ABC transporter permease [Corynebacterium variabile]
MLTRLRPGRRAYINTLVFLALIAIWWIITATNIVKPLFLPSPGAVVSAFWDANTCRPINDSGTAEVCGEDDYFLWQHLLASLERIAVGVGVGIVVGVALGFLMGTVNWIFDLVEPYLNFLRSLPPLGYMGLLIVWFGIGDVSKVWLLFLAAFPPIAMSTISGVRGVQQDRVLAARSLGADRGQVLRQVILPSALPQILSGIRVATGFAWTTVVAAELNNGIPGIGGLAYLSGTRLDTPLTIACIIVIGIAAVVLDLGLKKLSTALVPWEGKA